MFYLDEISIKECYKNGEQHTTCTIPAHYNLDRYQSPHIKNATYVRTFRCTLGKSIRRGQKEERDDELTGLRPKEVPLAEEPQRGIGLCGQLTRKDRE